jgi:hypothetical protein
MSRPLSPGLLAVQDDFSVEDASGIRYYGGGHSLERGRDFLVIKRKIVPDRLHAAMYREIKEWST